MSGWWDLTFGRVRACFCLQSKLGMMPSKVKLWSDFIIFKGKLFFKRNLGGFTFLQALSCSNFPLDSLLFNGLRSKGLPAPTETSKIGPLCLLLPGVRTGVREEEREEGWHGNEPPYRGSKVSKSYFPLLSNVHLSSHFSISIFISSIDFTE